MPEKIEILDLKHLDISTSGVENFKIISLDQKDGDKLVKFDFTVTVLKMKKWR